jgi:acetylornithine deacetylase
LSTYAPRCTLKIERRTLPGETRSQVERELRDLVGEEASVNCFFDRAPFTVEGDAHIVSCVRDAAAEVTGQEPVEAGVGYWMDAAIFAAAGIPTVNIGPAGAGAHETVEWVDLDSVVTCAKVLVNAARRFCVARIQ